MLNCKKKKKKIKYVIQSEIKGFKMLKRVFADSVKLSHTQPPHNLTIMSNFLEKVSKFCMRSGLLNYHDLFQIDTQHIKINQSCIEIARGMWSGKCWVCTLPDWYHGIMLMLIENIYLILN